MLSHRAEGRKPLLLSLFAAIKKQNHRKKNECTNNEMGRAGGGDQLGGREREHSDGDPGEGTVLKATDNPRYHSITTSAAWRLPGTTEGESVSVPVLASGSLRRAAASR